MRRFFAILVIWLGAAAAWMVLGSTLLVRSGDVSRGLESEVHQLWGAPIEQRPPTGVLIAPTPELVVGDATAKTGVAQPNSREKVAGAPAEPNGPQGKAPKTAAGVGAAEQVTATDTSGSDRPAQDAPVESATDPNTQPSAPPNSTPARLNASKLDVELHLEHRKKGLIWFPTYTVDFGGTYSFENPESESRELAVTLPLQKTNALYEGFEVLADGKPIRAEVQNGQAVFRDKLAAKQTKKYTVRYRSRGTERWNYHLTAGTGRVDGFELNLKTDFADVDFPSGTLSPSEHQATADGWQGKWKFSSLVASTPIGIAMPQLLNPGPLASRITFFAPLSLLFFFFVVAILATSQKRELHPLHYFFLSCAFFAFHLLFSYMVDHVAVGPAFAISAGVSVLLVVSYARLFVGWKFALREMGLAQLIYLVLFSFTFFFDGYTGLSVTVGAIVTLFLVMQITGRKSWRELLGEQEAPAPKCAAPYRCGVPALEQADPAE